MLQPDHTNTLFQLAADLVNHTSQHLFLTGKAGTGKTTFLKHIKEHTQKNAVIIAPTGVAAINAGGVTMHSFFQLPFGPFVPGILRRENVIGFAEVTDKNALFKNIHFSSDKRQLLQELELLIIDEVSMLRCDMLDAIDAILRHFRKQPQLPYGGVQVVYIGDLFQLPPVIAAEEWKILQEYYESPFFFSAKVVAEATPLYIELKKIYRQSEEQFIGILNRIRNNQPTKTDFDILNSRYSPHFTSQEAAHYITLTTHNKKADAINTAELNKLPGKSHTFKAIIKDDFSDKALPTDAELQLKAGAQVMFIKNDSGSGRRYFNGKIATVKSIAGDEIIVSFGEGEDDLQLEKETWKNIRYIYNKENDEIDEEELGSFTQYPIRLAWAITIHKSQGLTFEKAIIDAGSSFAAGQVYVALSRCTSLDGMVLKSKIFSAGSATDKRVLSFAQREVDVPQLEEVLEKEKYTFWATTLMKTFDWTKLIKILEHWVSTIPGKKLSDVEGALQLAHGLLGKAIEQAGVAQKFKIQLEKILQHTLQTGDTAQLKQRMEKAVSYFAQSITTGLLEPLQQHLSSLQYASKLKKYKEEVLLIESFIWQQLQRLLYTKYGDVTFCADPSFYNRYSPSKEKGVKKEKETKPEKGTSQRDTLQLFKEGKTIDEIAVLRNLAISTVEGHLAYFVRNGELSIDQLVEGEKITAILKVIDEVGSESIGRIKSRLGEEFEFGEIRAVLNHKARMAEVSIA